LYQTVFLQKQEGYMNTYGHILYINFLSNMYIQHIYSAVNNCILNNGRFRFSSVMSSIIDKHVLNANCGEYVCDQHIV